MPKIEVPLSDLLNMAGLAEAECLGEMLEPLKAELDGVEGDTVKIELNDTNRPDLWTAEGVARGIRCQREGARPRLSRMGDPAGEIHVSKDLCDLRPFIAAFTAEGWEVTEDGLLALIASQEKLASSFGRNRRTAAIGFYDLRGIAFPVAYRTAPPDTVFHPLGEPVEMRLDQVLRNTESGVKYAGLLEGFSMYPLLTDAGGQVLSFPPVLNSNSTGRVDAGARRLFCEVTGTDWHTVNLTASILACNLEDRGAVIRPIKVLYPDGRDTVTPIVYRDTLEAGMDAIASVLGIDPATLDIEELLGKMDYSSVKVHNGTVRAVMPPYRRDGIHEMDLIEDIAISRGLNSIEPLLPPDYTVGRAAPSETAARWVRTILVGAGCEEIMRPILTSSDKITGRTRSPEEPVKISNPMTAEYAVVSNTLLPALLEVEAASGHAVFPHRIFTVGEVLRRAACGLCETSVSVAASSGDSDFGEMHSILGALCHYRSLSLKLREQDDPRFIPGRSAEVLIEGVPAGIMGEFHPEVLNRWGIGVPVSAFEVTLESLR